MTGEARQGAGLDLWFAVWSRRKWLAILAFAAPLSAAISLITFLPNIYRATASVLADWARVLGSTSETKTPPRTAPEPRSVTRPRTICAPASHGMLVRQIPAATRNPSKTRRAN